MAPSSQLLLARKRKKMQLQLIVTIVFVISAVFFCYFNMVMMTIVIHKTQKVKLSY